MLANFVLCVKQDETERDDARAVDHAVEAHKRSLFCQAQRSLSDAFEFSLAIDGIFVEVRFFVSLVNDNVANARFFIGQDADAVWLRADLDQAGGPVVSLGANRRQLKVDVVLGAGEVNLEASD